MEMNWCNIQVSKIEAKYLESCSQVFYKTIVLKILEKSEKNTCGGVLFYKSCISSFCILLK